MQIICMKAQEIIDSIKAIVGVKLSETVSIKLEEITLENGTVLVADKFEAGESVFIKTEDENVALPIGDYELPEGKKLVVKEEGLIDSVSGEEVEEEVKEEVEEVAEEVEAKETTEKVKSKTESIQTVYATKEEVSEVRLMIEEIKTLLEKSKKLNDEPVVEKEVELSSETIVEPIVHNPEKEEKKTNINFTGNNSNSMLDDIFAGLNKIK